MALVAHLDLELHGDQLLKEVYVFNWKVLKLKAKSIWCADLRNLYIDIDKP